jgi:mono/diheme cytochrome c family protein
MHDGVDRSGNQLYPAFPYNHYTHVTDDDIAAIYAFLMTRQPVRAETPATHLPFPLNIRPILAGWNLLFLDRAPIASDPGKSPEWNRGAYLVEGLGHCQACHSPHNGLGAEETSQAFTGGLADGWEGPGLTAASSPAAIAWNADALYRFLRHGLDDQHAAAAGPMGAVSHDLSGVPEADVRAMAAYIASMTGAADPAREQRVAARVAAAQVAPLALADSLGAAIFAGACAGCHGAGAPMMLNGRPSLALGSSVTAPTPRNAAQIILNGLQPGPGERGPWMPPFAASLTDAQIASVLTYLRARFADRPEWTDIGQTVHSIREDHRS